MLPYLSPFSPVSAGRRCWFSGRLPCTAASWSPCPAGTLSVAVAATAARTGSENTTPCAGSPPSERRGSLRRHDEWMNEWMNEWHNRQNVTVIMMWWWGGGWIRGHIAPTVIILVRECVEGRNVLGTIYIVTPALEEKGDCWTKAHIMILISRRKWEKENF